jgi:hypothetical protein
MLQFFMDSFTKLSTVKKNANIVKKNQYLLDCKNSATDAESTEFPSRPSSLLNAVV